MQAAIADELAQHGLAMDFAVVSNPEFQKEGAAVADFLRPERVVIGADDERATPLMRSLHAPFVRNHDRPRAGDGPAQRRVRQVRRQSDAGHAHRFPHTALRWANGVQRRRERANAGKEFRTPDFEAIKAALRTPVVFDGRYLYEPAVMAALGIEYHCIGRAEGIPLR